MKKIIFYLSFFLITACTTKQAVNPSIVELVDTNYRFSTASLVAFCDANKVDKNSIYQWQNHWIILNPANASELAEKLDKKYPSLTIHVFENPFYNFNREKITGEKPAKEWTNIIMTANLVSDTLKQKEYLEYHRTQFEKWPELSKGFCNAHFQQLLVFRSGRQLMLVISIPKGKTLDELNPKTIENNPRVADWNKIMANYQEGIEDAPKGSTWVMFSPINR